MMANRTEPVADEILYVPRRAFDEIESMVANPAVKTVKTAKKKTSRKRTKRPKFRLDLPEIEPFGGFDNFEVRTALVRPKGYRPDDAPTVSAPGTAAMICRHMVYYDQEHMVVLALDSGTRLIALFEAYIGGTAKISVEIKHLIKVPLLTGASSAIIAHNHPSGSREYSQDDHRVTDAVSKAFDCVGIHLFDSLVVALDGWKSVKHGDEDRWP